LEPLLAAMKLFVDVSTSQASIGDWKYYQKSYARKVIQREQAAGIAQGFEHEIRNLQFTAGLAILEDLVPSADVPIPEEKLLVDDLIWELESNLAVSRLVFDAHIHPELTISVAKLREELKKLLPERDDFRINLDITVSGSVPKPLLFVIAELCRNAFNHSIEGDRQADLKLTQTSTGKLRLVVINKTRNANRPRTGTLDSETFGGQNLAARVVKQILRGRFTFEIHNGLATAIVTVNSKHESGRDLERRLNERLNP